MATITVRNLDDEIKELLRISAAKTAIPWKRKRA